MERLSGLDAAFLYLETPSAHMHVVGVMRLDAADVPATERATRLRDRIAERLAVLPRLRQRVQRVPFDLDHPVWVDDAHFHLDRHVRRIGAPSPGGERELADVVGWISRQALHRDRPLWEAWIVDGLEKEGMALVVKIHHAALDGVAGANLFARLFDTAPNADAPARPTSEPAGDDASTTPGSLFTQALRDKVSQPARLARQLARTGRSLAPLLRGGADIGVSEPPALPFTAPRTRLNRSLTPERAVAFGRARLEDLKCVRRAFDTKLNDVVLAAATAALRDYLLHHDDLPDRPLVASVPISERTPGDAGTSGNHVSALFVALPVQLEDPLEQLCAIHHSSRSAKRVHAAVGGGLLREWVQLASPALITGGARLYSRLKLADRHRPIHNLVISNVPGPPMPLYAGGARLVSSYPLGPILEGAAVNITVMSYRDGLDFGVIACPRVMPDPWRLAEGFSAAVQRLRQLVPDAPAAERSAIHAPTPPLP